jgi:methylenetetrahydrofolate reductase (NADPH)
MKVVDHLAQAKSTLFSIEILPPLKGRGIQSIFDGIDPLIEFKPSFIDVTYHREEYLYKELPSGGLEKIPVRKRPGTVGISAALINKYNIDVVPHIICGGFTVRETEDALLDLHYLGIDNVLALRGDSIKSEPSFVPEHDGHPHAIDLVKQIAAINKGKYLDDDFANITPTNFCIGVAGYPEKHFEAPNLTSDLKFLKAKIDAGAEYIVTQMFFDNEKFCEFERKCREMGITVPIIPGLKILTSKRQAQVLPKTFHIDIPEPLLEAVDAAKNDAEAKEVGIEWCIQQAKGLIGFGAPCLHFYTMGVSEATRRVASAIY